MTIDNDTDPGIDDKVRLLTSGCEFGDSQLEEAMRRRLAERLAEAKLQGRPLRVYAGYDPSAPDLHLGHSITLRKLRQFQRLGHEVTVVIGTVTAMVGDTSDRSTSRPRKSSADVEGAAKTYADQISLILDPDRTTVLKNGDWLGDLRLPHMLDLASQFTVQQFLARDNYRRRLDCGEPVGLHEFFYALLQGYDAVHLRADVQLGATEQLFNILAGAKLQEAAGQKPCAALTFPILVGIDGVDRMSKSRGNYVALADPSEDQFGKIMSVSDATMLQWVDLVADWSPGEISSFHDAVLKGDLHPMEAKKKLAYHVVEMYHGPGAALSAQDRFERVHQLRSQPDVIPETPLAEPLAIVELLVQTGAAASKSAARRLIAGGGVTVEGERVSSNEHLVVPPATLKVGTRRFYRVVSE
ncbi:MAG: tyrosine--tRNA ligase [Actinomycetota bacterium]|nr:tyrosine--tRNA ligase [Actinomycetota bacterium]